MLPQLSGIYIIFCSINHRIYLGSSVRVFKRWKAHVSTLRRNVHANKYLQNAWNKYGESNFHFVVVEECSLGDVFPREQFWLDELWAQTPELLFNVARDATKPSLGRKLNFSAMHRARISASKKGTPSHRKGAINSTETRAKIRAARAKQILPPMTEEHKQKISKALMGKKNALGNKHTPEEIEKIAASKRGKKRAPRSEEWQRKISEANRGRTLSEYQKEVLRRANTGKVRTPEQRARISNANSKDYIATSPEGEEFAIRGLVAFCKEHGLSADMMRLIAKGKYKQSRGWKCRYA